MIGSDGDSLKDLPKGWDLEVTYKPIRNIWFRVDPHGRRFRISAPVGISSASLVKAIEAKAGWMASKAAEPAVSPLIPEHVRTGVSCLVRGAACPVTVHSPSTKNRVRFHPEAGIDIHVKAGLEPARILSDWFRDGLKRDIPDLLAVWGPRLGVGSVQFRIRKMKTRWGSCNIRAKRIWINLALACLPYDLLEYVLVHELLHLLEPSHNSRFYSLMENAIPEWKSRKDRLRGYAPGLG